MASALPCWDADLFGQFGILGYHIISVLRNDDSSLTPVLPAWIRRGATRPTLPGAPRSYSCSCSCSCKD